MFYYSSALLLFLLYDCKYIKYNKAALNELYNWHLLFFYTSSSRAAVSFHFYQKTSCTCIDFHSKEFIGFKFKNCAKFFHFLILFLFYCTYILILYATHPYKARVHLHKIFIQFHVLSLACPEKFTILFIATIHFVCLIRFILHISVIIHFYVITAVIICVWKGWR